MSSIFGSFSLPVPEVEKAKLYYLTKEWNKNDEGTSMPTDDSVLATITTPNQGDLAVIDNFIDGNPAGKTTYMWNGTEWVEVGRATVGDDKSISLSNGILSLFGFDTATEGQQLRIVNNGTAEEPDLQLEWFTPSWNDLTDKPFTKTSPSINVTKLIIDDSVYLDAMGPGVPLEYDPEDMSGIVVNPLTEEGTLLATVNAGGVEHQYLFNAYYNEEQELVIKPFDEETLYFISIDFASHTPGILVVSTSDFFANPTGLSLKLELVELVKGAEVLNDECISDNIARVSDVDAKIAGSFKYCGTKESFNDLLSWTMGTNPSVGDVFTILNSELSEPDLNTGSKYECDSFGNVIHPGDHVVCVSAYDESAGTYNQFRVFAPKQDLSGYYDKTEVDAKFAENFRYCGTYQDYSLLGEAADFGDIVLHNGDVYTVLDSSPYSTDMNGTKVNAGDSVVYVEDGDRRGFVVLGGIHDLSAAGALKYCGTIEHYFAFLSDISSYSKYVYRGDVYTLLNEPPEATYDINGTRIKAGDSLLYVGNGTPEENDKFVVLGSASDLPTHNTDADAHSELFDAKADKATTLSGYGITDAYTKTEVDGKLDAKADKSSVYTKEEIDNKLTSALHYKGSQETFQALVDSTTAETDPYVPTAGDVWNITTAGGVDAHGVAVDAGDNVIYNGTGWDVSSGTIDLSGYYDKTEVDAKLTGTLRYCGNMDSFNGLLSWTMGTNPSVGDVFTILNSELSEPDINTGSKYECDSFGNVIHSGDHVVCVSAYDESAGTYNQFRVFAPKQDKPVHTQVTLDPSDFEDNYENNGPALIISASIDDLNPAKNYSSMLSPSIESCAEIANAQFYPFTKVESGMLSLYCTNRPTKAVTINCTFIEVS